MKIIAHRCGPTVYPEQTITSARLALYSGADMVEVDVRYTKDKKLACSHDPNAKRVFGVDKMISDMTETEYLSLRQVKDPAFGSHLLEHYLKCGVKKLLIHVKEAEVIPDLLDVLARYDYLEDVVLGVMKVDAVRMVKEYDKNIKVLAFMPKVDDIPDYVQAGVDYIRLWEDWMTIETVEAVKKHPVELWIMIGKDVLDSDVGVTTPEGLRKVLDYGVDGILINDISLLQEALLEIQ